MVLILVKVFKLNHNSFFESDLNDLDSDGKI